MDLRPLFSSKHIILLYGFILTTIYTTIYAVPSFAGNPLKEILLGKTACHELPQGEVKHPDPYSYFRSINGDSNCSTVGSAHTEATQPIQSSIEKQVTIGTRISPRGCEKRYRLSALPLSTDSSVSEKAHKISDTLLRFPSYGTTPDNQLVLFYCKTLGEQRECAGEMGSALITRTTQVCCGHPCKENSLKTAWEIKTNGKTRLIEAGPLLESIASTGGRIMQVKTCIPRKDSPRECALAMTQEAANKYILKITENQNPKNRISH